MKIKLIAIARDEAAYLPEWIFHHLYFGFDEIEIYINYTTDNSVDLLRKIQKKYPVNFKNAEYLVENSYTHYDSLVVENFLKANPLQSRAYAEAYSNTNKTDFSHVMFLDVDEFWTPTCFTKNIKNQITELGDPTVTSFLWKNKVGDTEEFGRPFKEENLYINSEDKKMIVKTDFDIKFLTAHNCSIDMRDNLKNFRVFEKNNSYILHRFQRSEIEYISLLGRGNLQDLKEFGHRFNLKSNRAGFVSSDNSLKFMIDKNVLEKYNQSYQVFITDNDLVKEIELGKKFVSDRANFVLEYIRENVEANKIVNKVIKGLPIEKELYPNRSR